MGWQRGLSDCLGDALCISGGRNAQIPVCRHVLSDTALKHDEGDHLPLSSETELVYVMAIGHHEVLKFESQGLKGYHIENTRHNFAVRSVKPCCTTKHTCEVCW